MIIYKQPSDTRRNPEEPPLEDIGFLWDRLTTSTHPDRRKRALKNLGISTSDLKAQEIMRDLVRELDIKNYVIEPQPHTGVYYIKVEGKPIAVFKLGEKGPAIELSVRDLAVRLGLEEYVAPGMFCAVDHLQFFQTEDDEMCPVSKHLWNGHLAVVTAANKTHQKAIGILKPFIQKQETTSLSSKERREASFLLLALAAGLRDIKPEDRINETAIDAEDAFMQFKHPDLPYLGSFPHEEITKSLEPDVIAYLRSIVNSWNIEEITTAIGKRPLLYFDRSAEENPPHREKNQLEVSITNETGSLLTIYPDSNPDYRSPKVNPNRTCLSLRDKEDLENRLTLIKNYIQSHECFSLQDLVFHLYPESQIYSELLTEAQNTGSTPDECRSGSVFELIGRFTPEKALPEQLFLSFSDIMRTTAETPVTPVTEETSLSPKKPTPKSNSPLIPVGVKKKIS